MICEPVETAETSTDEANFPTINKSTAPYIACKNNANKTGNAKKIRGCKILPWVNDVCFVIISSSLKIKAGQESRHFSLPSYPAIVSRTIHPPMTLKA